MAAEMVKYIAAGNPHLVGLLGLDVACHVQGQGCV